MQSLNVDLGAQSYPIYIGTGLLGQPELMQAALGSKNIVVTDSRVAPLYMSDLQSTLGERLSDVVVLPEGESSKNIDSIMKIIDVLTASASGRDSTLIALGGGVIGDMTGFAASIYLRGIDFVQIPTTLLAQVDSSVGGKTGVNHERGKNLIGAFHQPRCVISDTATLRTLEQNQFRSGLAEVIKHGLVADEEFFSWLERNISVLLQQDPATLDHAIRRCCEIKAQIVAEDEREQGRRALLNLGHTFGHAIEGETAYHWLHGEAVAAGTVLAARLSEKLGMLDPDAVQRIASLFGHAGLPVRAPEISREAWHRWMRVDKKANAGKLRFVLLESIGKAQLHADVPDNALNEILRTAHV
ncbi:MAG: 3-dehydroquinate synthase [Gammaproteobacteria bacterium]|nr:3-dehydroquinate synthase [Gammaproteobacteria bacterium]